MPTIKSLKKSTKSSYTHDNFYNGRPWRRIRALKLQQEPRCEVSLAIRITVKATTVDHRLSRRFWPQLQYELSNLISMTESNHAKKRRLESTITTKEQYLSMFGLNGALVIERINK